MFKRYNLLLFNTIFILYLEIVFKAFIFNSVFNINTIFTVLFSLCTAFILSIIESLFGKILNKIIMIAFSVIIWLIFTSQFIYYQYYETIFSVYSLFHGSQVLEFINSIFTVMLNNIIPIILMIIPIIFMFVYIKKIDNERKNCKFYLIVILWILICFFGCLGLMKMLNNDDTYSSYNLYYNTHVPKLTVKNLGLITEIRLDIKRTLFGFKENIILTNSDNTILEDNTVYHIMEIDFEDLINNETDETIKQMDEYFSSVSPTATNEYTGMFEGKNLIYIIAEAFSPMAINEELTPTLYKLYNEGFQFENFYTPVFYVSTSDGEYTTLTSLLPEDGVWSMSRSSDIYLPFVYGNLFKDYGYNAYAYHDGTYTYYNRDESLPNMGYTYKACYNGLNINCGMWPQSDIEMMDATVEEYINDDNFVTYYMTISGHLEYTYNGNSIATKNRSYVEDLDYSEAIQAYLATQIELDRAISDLIDQLDAAGKLEDTVIAISADHYPYGLTDDEILSYADYIDDIKFDIHRNVFLLWNSEIEESVKVTKYASSLDILPTILNLFNVEYDSRLLMGEDILSESDGLVIFNDRSWITNKGRYNAVTEEFTSFNGNEEISEDYIEKINTEVYNKFLMSKLILENDYYSIILKESS